MKLIYVDGLETSLEVKESVTVEAYRSTYRSYGILAGHSESALTKHSALPFTA